MLKEKIWKRPRYDSEYYEWREYSKNCPWKEKESCSVTYMACMYTRCAPWHFLKKYKELNVTRKEEKNNLIKQT